jgi:hypothetical protein
VPDSLANVLDDLQAMTPRDRRAVLRSLTPAERDMLGATLDQAPAPEDPLREGGQLFSPWLAACLHRARSDSSSDGATGRMTAASRQALIRSAEAIEGSQRPEGNAATGTGRSLFDAVNGMLSPRKGRP